MRQPGKLFEWLSAHLLTSLFGRLAGLGRRLMTFLCLLRRFMRFARMLMSGLRMFLRLVMISVVKVFSRSAMRLSSLIMVLRGIVMCVLGHSFSFVRSGDIEMSATTVKYAFGSPLKRVEG